MSIPKHQLIGGSPCVARRQMIEGSIVVANSQRNILLREIVLVDTGAAQQPCSAAGYLEAPFMRGD